jgi:uncharacterized damage-inducible protein DinB
MTDLTHVRTFVRYAAWANDVLYDSLREVPERELVAPRPSVFGNVMRTLNHVYVIDLIWQAHLEGRPHGFTARNTETHPPLAELHTAQKQLNEWYVRYADDIPAPACDEIVNFTFVGGGAGSMSRGDILLHVANHTTYHRGHITDMLMQIPFRPPATDLPVFLRDVPQATGGNGA